MSRAARLLYLTLLSVSLLFAWLSIQWVRKASPDPWSRIGLVGIAMLWVAWVLTKAPRFLSRLEEKYPALIKGFTTRQLLFSMGLLFGGLAVLCAPNQKLLPIPILLIWAAGIILFLSSTATPLQRGFSGFTNRVLTLLREHRWELLGLFGLTVLALLLRSTALDSIPYNIHGDEGEMGLVARSVLSGDLRDPFATTFLTHSTLWFFIQTLALRLFGDDITGLRMLSAILGTLTVPALYIFARPLFGSLVAFIATALLAVYHFHVHFSRIGLNNIADPLMMVLTLAAFFYGYRRKSSLGYALAGVFMGLAQYFYFGARLIPIIVITLTLYLILLDRHSWLHLLKQTGLMMTGLLLAVAPLFRWYIAHPGVYAGRVMEHGLLQNNNYIKIQENGQSLAAAFATHAYRAFGYFFTINETSPFHNAGIPLLDHGMDVLFLIGIVLLLLNLKRAEYLVLLLWVGGTAIFGGFLLWDYPQSTRYVIAAPALCLLLALSLAKIRELLAQQIALSERSSTGIILLPVLALMTWNVHFYFNIYTPQNRYGNTQSLTEIAHYLQPQEGRRFVYMFTSPYFYLNHGTIRFVANSPAGVDVNETLTSIDALPEPAPGLEPLFIFVPERLSEVEVVKQRYPDGQVHETLIKPNGDRAILYIYEP